MSFHTEQREVVTEYHHAYQRQSSKLGYFLENSHTMGKKQTVFTFIHQSKQQTEAPQALFGRKITGKVRVIYRNRKTDHLPNHIYDVQITTLATNQ